MILLCHNLFVRIGRMHCKCRNEMEPKLILDRDDAYYNCPRYLKSLLLYGTLIQCSFDNMFELFWRTSLYLHKFYFLTFVSHQFLLSARRARNFWFPINALCTPRTPNLLPSLRQFLCTSCTIFIIF